MSLLKLKGVQETPLAQLVSSLRTKIIESGNSVTGKKQVSSVLSLESLGEVEKQALAHSVNDMQHLIRSSYSDLNDNGHSLSFEELTEAQIEAGIYVAMAAGDPVAYARAALENRAEGSSDIRLVESNMSGSYGTMDYRNEVSMEVFDQTQLANMIPYSISFNVAAARQDEFAETFYPTVVISPENGGIDVSIDQTTVHNQIRRDSAGRVNDFSKKNLLEAVRNHTILEDESTKVVPFLREDNSNASAFVPVAKLAPKFRTVSGHAVRTSALLFNQRFDIIGLSDHPVLVGAGVLDHTDALAKRMTLASLYTEIGGSVLHFNTANLPRNGFQKSAEGGVRESTLNFRTESLVLNKETLTVSGVFPTELQAVFDNDWTVRLGTTVTGHADHETAAVEVMGGKFRVVRISDDTGAEISIEAGAGKAFADLVAADLVALGYELNATFTNSNRRTRGLMLNTTRVTERFDVQLGAPISAPSPIGSDRDARDLESLINAARIRNSNNAITSLLNYSETLSAFVDNRNRGIGGLEIEGVGRHVVVPYYEEIDLNLVTVVNSLRSKDKAEDISEAIVQTIRDVVYRMYRQSAYQAAINASTIGSKKPTLLVGTDTIIQRHLMTSGDTRTFGMAFDAAKIVTTLDERMNNKIVLTFTREGGEGGIDALSFGAHAWIPELASSIQASRDGAIVQEAMVQPRSRHVNNLPIMAVINVEGLTDVMTSKIAP